LSGVVCVVVFGGFAFQAILKKDAEKLQTQNGLERDKHANAKKQVIRRPTRSCLVFKATHFIRGSQS